MEIHWLTQLFVTQAVRLKNEDCTLILKEIAEVKEEISKVKEALHKLGRNFGFCMSHVPEVALAHLVSNVTPPYNVPTMHEGVA